MTPLLSIETSGELCGVCLYLSTAENYSMDILKKNIHSEKIFEIIDLVLKSADTDFSEIKTLAVSAGPGSFTGLRIGMSAAKGLAFTNNLSIVPVPTFEALALSISGTLADGEDFVIANNASRDECYYAKFKTVSGKYEITKKVCIVEKSFAAADQTKNKFGSVFATDKIKSIGFPPARAVAEWAYLFGKDLLTFDHDLLEPDYLKNFIIKVQK